MLLQAITFSSLLASRALGGVIAPREGESLFKPETGKPEAQDVIDFVKDGSEDSFDKTFSAVMYAVANQPDHIEKLFNDKGDGSHEFIFFDPITHEPTPHAVSLGEVRDFHGTSDLESVKTRWWVAAAFKVLKDEWSSSYEPLVGNVLQPTNKGQAFEKAILARYAGFVATPMNVGDVDLKASIWLMSVLLRRNAVWSTYSTEQKSDWAKTPETVRDVVGHPPSLWIGYTKSGDDNTSDFKSYAMGSIEYRERSDIILSRPDAGNKATATIDLAADASSFGAILIHLEDLTEAWEAEKWYDRKDAPALTEPLVTS